MIEIQEPGQLAPSQEDGEKFALIEDADVTAVIDRAIIHNPKYLHNHEGGHHH